MSRAPYHDADDFSSQLPSFESGRLLQGLADLRREAHGKAQGHSVRTITLGLLSRLLTKQPSYPAFQRSPDGVGNHDGGLPVLPARGRGRWRGGGRRVKIAAASSCGLLMSELARCVHVQCEARRNEASSTPLSICTASLFGSAYLVSHQNFATVNGPVAGATTISCCSFGRSVCTRGTRNCWRRGDRGERL